MAPDGRLFAGYVDGHGAAGLLCSADGASWKATCAAPSTGCAESACWQHTDTVREGRSPPSQVVAGSGDNANAEGAAGSASSRLLPSTASSGAGQSSADYGGPLTTPLLIAGFVAVVVGLVVSRLRQPRR
jgi:hypothetical protein